jgi:pilus assembly protein Flp/PilA
VSAYPLPYRGKRYAIERGTPVKKVLERLRVVRPRRDDGASAVEYGLLVALIAVVIAATVIALGTTLRNKFGHANCTVAAQDQAAAEACADDE